MPTFQDAKYCSIKNTSLTQSKCYMKMLSNGIPFFLYVRLKMRSEAFNSLCTCVLICVTLLPVAWGPVTCEHLTIRHMRID